MSYLDLYHSGELRRKVMELKECLNCCSLCPRECGALCLSGERRECGAGERLEISDYGQHFGEEATLKYDNIDIWDVCITFLSSQRICCKEQITLRGE